MPEPTTTTVAIITTACVTVLAMVAFGVSIGLRPDVPIAGFGGSLATIVLLNTVPTLCRI